MNLRRVSDLIVGHSCVASLGACNAFNKRHAATAQLPCSILCILAGIRARGRCKSTGAPGSHINTHGAAAGHIARPGYNLAPTLSCYLPPTLLSSCSAGQLRLLVESTQIYLLGLTLKSDLDQL